MLSYASCSWREPTYGQLVVHNNIFLVGAAEEKRSLENKRDGMWQQYSKTRWSPPMTFTGYSLKKGTPYSRWGSVCRQITPAG